MKTFLEMGSTLLSRLEPLAPIGGILVSESVNRNLGNKKGIETNFVREETLKNVKDPIKIYEVKVDAEEPSITTPAQSTQDESKTGNKKAVLIGAGAIIVILLALVLYQYQSSESLTPDQTVFETELEKSIAVRPFWNESADQENEYFVNGMTEDIRNNLAKISDMRVISRGSMEKYRTTNQSTKEIAQELDVRYLLEGTVQKLGNQVKIHAQLIHAEVDHHVWEDTYILDISDVTEIFTLQSDIAKIIATELNAKISFDEEKRLDNVPTSDISAYDYVLRGDQMLSDFWMTFDVKYLNLSMELYKKALENDPDFTRAILGKARIFLRNENYDSALLYIEKAQKIDPEFPDGYFLKGSYYGSQGQDGKAFTNFSKALKMEPNDWRVNFRLGDISIRKRNDVINGLPYIQKAYNLSTEYRDQMYLNIGRCYFHIGDFDKAEYYFSKALELNVGCTIIMSYGWLYHNKGEFQQALDFYDSICNSMDCNVFCYSQRFYTYLYLGNYDLSLENYNKAVDSGRDPSYKVDLVTLACVYKGLGREAESNIILDEIRIQLEEFQSPFSYFLLASILCSSK